MGKCCASEESFISQAASWCFATCIKQPGFGFAAGAKDSPYDKFEEPFPMVAGRPRAEAAKSTCSNRWPDQCVATDVGSLQVLFT